MRNSDRAILRLVYSADTVQNGRMSEGGRLIRVRRSRGDPHPAAYVVAVPKTEKAIAVIRQSLGVADALIDDLGGVSEGLLRTLSVPDGEFVRIEGIKHVAQQQQQPQAVNE